MTVFRFRASLQMENLALRHQLGVLQRSCRRPSDRIFWSWLSRVWSSWQDALVIVQPATVIAWRRRKFREYWTRLSRPGKLGRPTVPREVRDLIRRMSSANPLAGAPRIVGELRKIGIHLASVPQEPRQRHRRNRLPCRSYRAKPGPLRLSHPCPRTPIDEDSFARDRQGRHACGARPEWPLTKLPGLIAEPC